MTPAIILRLMGEVSTLQNRVYGAASLAALMDKDALPVVTPCAHVVPSGIVAADKPDAMTGLYLQDIARGFAVFLSLRVADPNGPAALDEAAGLVDAIIHAVAGWEPSEDAIGVFGFLHAVLRTFERGVAVYEISFSIPDQLRIE